MITPTEHDFRNLMWGHSLASVELSKIKKWSVNRFGLPTRVATIKVTGTCWTPTRPKPGDTFVWLASGDAEVTAKLTKVTPAGTVWDMSFWEGIVTSHQADEVN